MGRGMKYMTKTRKNAKERRHQDSAKGSSSESKNSNRNNSPEKINMHYVNPNMGNIINKMTQNVNKGKKSLKDKVSFDAAMVAYKAAEEAKEAAEEAKKAAKEAEEAKKAAKEAAAAQAKEERRRPPPPPLPQTLDRTFENNSDPKQVKHTQGSFGPVNLFVPLAATEMTPNKNKSQQQDLLLDNVPKSNNKKGSESSVYQYQDDDFINFSKWGGGGKIKKKLLNKKKSNRNKGKKKLNIKTKKNVKSKPKFRKKSKMKMKGGAIPFSEINPSIMFDHIKDNTKFLYKDHVQMVPNNLKSTSNIVDHPHLVKSPEIGLGVAGSSSLTHFASP
jgi:hypothetical protein